jgi:acyl-coenzyme A synthetase/AMP-(fatty) acid ligase
MQTHRLILHRVLTDTNELHLRSDDRLTLLSPPTYSVSLRHLFGALLNAATVFPFNVVEQGVAAIPDWIARERITIYFSVPSVFREWTRLLDPETDLRTVRVVQIGGDTVTADDVARYRQWFSDDCIFLNSFASNEAGIVRYFVADKTTPIEPGPLPVGHAVPDKEVLVLGDDDRVLPANAVGRIAIRSEFLSPGYWRQPALTEAAFQVDATDPSKRVYHTGDLGLLRPDGCLIFKGRVASRAKVGGVTVAVEEVETALAAHPAIEQVVVTVREAGATGPRLIAYVVPRRSGADARHDAPTVTALRTFLRGKLPSSMVPASYVFLDALPTTAHGKVDRAKLPVPDGERPALATPFRTPRDGHEAQVAAICEAMIGVRPIGADDDLFDRSRRSAKR